MARTANVFARVEPELKEQAESVFRSGQFYFDACCNSSKTAFLKNAENTGCDAKRIKGDYPGRK